eukprot:2925427-Amphidinium_carterae.1
MAFLLWSVSTRVTLCCRIGYPVDLIARSCSGLSDESGERLGGMQLVLAFCIYACPLDSWGWDCQA